MSMVKDFILRVKREGGMRITVVTVAAGDPEAAKLIVKSRGYIVYGEPQLKCFAP